MRYSVFLLFLTSFSLVAQNPLKQLEESPRHHEWITISVDDQELQTFLVFPEVADKAPVVILIHENRGLNDWARSMADQIAAMGYIVLAPDLLSGKAPDGGGTSAFKNSDAARTALYTLDPDQITKGLQATLAHGKQIDAANGKVAVIGFCWGGSQTFRFVSNEDQLAAAFVCYGTGPKNEEAYKTIKTPVYGFYGGNDNRVNATIEKSQQAMDALNKVYTPVIYEGAGHGFFRAGEADNASEANIKARKAGMERLQKLLSTL